MKGVRFNKKKSKQVVKIVLITLSIVIVVSCVHASLYRYLIDEVENDDHNQKRIWCIVRYPSSLRVYNYVMHSFHFFWSIYD